MPLASSAGGAGGRASNAKHTSGRDSTVRARMDENRFDRIALVVHPRRELRRALATLREWAEGQDAELVQLRSPGQLSLIHI